MAVTELDVHCFGKAGWLGSLQLHLSVQGLQACLAMPNFYISTEGLNSSPHACIENGLTPWATPLAEVLKIKWDEVTRV